ncbi:hypothetical protein AAFF_G00409730 [Aldrovandia affinis]|uniref:Uncharacterized protein n=1 Tax=Aldrovandia affinis TaxID=143900 RepID=A0AAD7SBZ6_9TELE|nr:hypothetical protein AAFF_G00409730 [Aldrovandia affinis]
MDKLRAEILTSLKSDIATLIRSELKTVLAEGFGDIKSELQAVKLELVANTAMLRSDLDKMKTTITDMEHGLSTCSDDMTALQATVGKLESAVTSLQEKCLDLEGRMRRSNIRILNVAEGPGSASPTAVSKLLREALHLDKDLVIDRSHRSLQPKHPSGKPRAIIAKLHYYQDCADILRRARETGPLQFNGTAILIFPDYLQASLRQDRRSTMLGSFCEDETGSVRACIILQDFGLHTTVPRSSFKIQWRQWRM